MNQSRTKASSAGAPAPSRLPKALNEAAALLRGPQRALPLIRRIASDGIRLCFEQRHLYSYATTKRSNSEALHSLFRWILDAQRPDGGVAAYYSLLSGYSRSYPEVTGYLVPTLYDYARVTNDPVFAAAAERATQWLLSLQMPNGAFPGGLLGEEARPSIFNTGQILQGLVRACVETNHQEIRAAALGAGDWLSKVQQANGSWSGPAAYQETSHTYYSMVAWALAELSARTSDRQSGLAAEKNLNWALTQFQPNGWIDGLNLKGHPLYLHFIAYVLEGVLECGILRCREDAIQAVARSAWVLLRKFEAGKYLPGAYQTDFKTVGRFACLTGNAQVSCVWLRLFEVSGDLRYLNAALKMNEMLKRLLPAGGRGIAGGVSGSYPIWGRYQPLRHISWGSKFLADALLLEQRLTRSLQTARIEVLSCAS